MSSHISLEKSLNVAISTKTPQYNQPSLESINIRKRKFHDAEETMIRRKKTKIAKREQHYLKQYSDSPNILSYKAKSGQIAK